MLVCSGERVGSSVEWTIISSAKITLAAPSVLTIFERTVALPALLCRPVCIGFQLSSYLASKSNA